MSVHFSFTIQFPVLKDHEELVLYMSVCLVHVRNYRTDFYEIRYRDPHYKLTAEFNFDSY
jgi:hypothetical protein